MPHTIRDRSILVEMQRRRDSEKVERFLFRRAKPEGEKIRERISTFVSTNRQAIEAVYGTLDLDFIEDRDAEAWEPLFAVLHVLDRPRIDELRNDALVLTGNKAKGEVEESLSLRLLADLRDVWPEGDSNAFSARLIESLKAIEDSPWASDVELTPRRLASFLRPFGIESRQVRVAERTAKGYLRSDLDSAFSCYLGKEGKRGKQPA